MNAWRITTTLRLLALFGRAVLIFIAAKLLSAEDMALFVIISSYAALFVIVNGLDYTRWIQHSIKSLDAVHTGYIVRLCAILILALNLLFLASALIVSQVFNIDIGLIFVFFLLVLCENYAQEGGRILVLLNKQLVSALGMFLRSFLPVTILLCYRLVNSDFALGDVLFWIILCSLFSSCVLWFYLLRITRGYKKFDMALKNWLIEGLRFSLYFLVATAAGKLLLAIDKTLINDWFGSETLAVYSVVFGAALIMIPLVDMTVAAYATPRLYDAKRLGLQRFEVVYRKYFTKTVWIVFFSAAAGILGFNVIFSVVYTQYAVPSLILVSLVFGSVAAIAVTLTPSLALIVLGKKKFTAASSLTALAFFAITSFGLRPDLVGLVLLFFTTNLILLTARIVYLERCIKTNVLEGN